MWVPESKSYLSIWENVFLHIAHGLAWPFMVAVVCSIWPSLLSFCSLSSCVDVCSVSSSQKASVAGNLSVCCDKSTAQMIHNAFIRFKAKHTHTHTHLCSLHHLSVPDRCHIWRAIYAVWCPYSQSDLDAAVPADLTRWWLPGNWDYCFVIQSLDRSCRGLHGEEARRNYH